MKTYMDKYTKEDIRTHKYMQTNELTDNQSPSNIHAVSYTHEHRYKQKEENIHTGTITETTYDIKQANSGTGKGLETLASKQDGRKQQTQTQNIYVGNLTDRQAKKLQKNIRTKTQVYEEANRHKN